MLAHARAFLARRVKLPHELWSDVHARMWQDEGEDMRKRVERNKVETCYSYVNLLILTTSFDIIYYSSYIQSLCATFQLL